jgi:hypothetical protein
MQQSAISFAGISTTWTSKYTSSMQVKVSKNQQMTPSLRQDQDLQISVRCPDIEFSMNTVNTEKCNNMPVILGRTLGAESAKP